MAYTKKTWIDGVTPIKASDLNNIENGISMSSPTGAIMQFAGVTAPMGWLICDGSTVSRTEYADLFSVIGTTYGSGNGSTTFNLPNLSGRVPVGLNVNKEWFNALGKTGGSEELQEHSHNQTMAGFPSIDGNANGTEEAYGYRVTNLEIGTLKRNVTSTTGTGNAGNLQPYITLNYIIKY